MAITVERLTAEIDADPSKAVAGIEVFEAAVAGAAKDRTANLDLDTGEAELHLAQWDAELDVATRNRTVHIDVDKDQGFAEIQGAISALEGLVSSGAHGLDELGDGFSEVGKDAETAAGAVGGGGGFSGAMSQASSAGENFFGVISKIGGGLGSLIAPVVIGALVTVLPGAFAAAAGGAAILVGALVPLLGLLGAIPVAIGAVVGVVGVLAAVFGPVIQGVTAYGQATKGASASADEMAQKQRAVVSANQAVASSTHQVQQAEQALSDARKAYNLAPEKAEENLRQAHFSATQAVLSERQAVLNLIDAQKNLKDAQAATSASMVTTTKETDYFTGKVYEVATASKSAVSSAEDERKARLAVRQAELSLAEAKDASGQAQLHLTQEEQKGIKNSDIMVQARRQLADAEYALKQAHQGVANAEYQRAQAEKALHDATVNGTSATQAWVAAQKNLSQEGVDFVKFIHDDLLPAFFDLSKKGQTALLPGVEAGLKDFLKLAGPAEYEIGVIGGMLGDTFQDLAQFWTDPPQRLLLTQIFLGLNDVLDDGLALIKPFSRIMADITKDATPMVVHILDDLGDSLNNLADWMDSEEGQKRTTQFFNDAAKFAGLWAKVLGPVAGILIGISNAAEPFAEKFLKDAAGWLDDIDKKVNSPKGQKNIFDYIKAQLPTIKVIGQIIGSIVDAMFTSSKGGKDSSFYKFLVAIRDDLLPPIEKAFEGFDASTFAADLVTNVGDLVGFLETIDWKEVGQDFHNISQDIHEISDAGEKSKPFLKFMEALTFASLTPPVVTWRILSSIFKSIPDDLHGVYEGAKNIGDGFKNAADKVADFDDYTKREMGKLPGWIDNNVTSPIGNFFSDLWKDVKRDTIERWSDIKDWFKDLPGWMHDHVISPISDAFSDFFTKVLPDLFKSGIKGAFKAGIEGIPGVKQGSDLFKWATGKWSGGPVSKDQPVIVGEKGPEFFMPSSSGRIMPASPTRQMMESTKAGIDPAQLEDILRKVLDRAKPDVKVEQTFNEKIDPKHVAAELAWELAG